MTDYNHKDPRVPVTYVSTDFPINCDMPMSSFQNFPLQADLPYTLNLAPGLACVGRSDYLTHNNNQFQWANTTVSYGDIRLKVDYEVSRYECWDMNQEEKYPDDISEGMVLASCMPGAVCWLPRSGKVEEVWKGVRPHKLRHCWLEEEEY